MAECNHTNERIRGLASFSDMNPIAGMDARGVITFADSAPQKTLKELGFFKNPSLFVPDDKEEILRMLKESTESRLSREITFNPACFLRKYRAYREVLVVNFRNIFFNQKYKEEIMQLTGKDLAIGTSNREGD